MPRVASPRATSRWPARSKIARVPDHMPTLDFAFLADAAEAEPGRKFYVLGGGIDQIAGPQFPLFHPHMSLVMRFLIHPTELGLKHHLEVRMIDADGGELAKIEGDIETQSQA